MAIGFSLTTSKQLIPKAEAINTRFIIMISMVAALGGLLFGFDTAIISGAIPYITSYFGLDGFSLGWAVSSILIGCAVGAMLAGLLADKCGRRMTLIMCAILFALSGLGSGLSSDFTLFVIFRLIGGLGVGAAAMISPMYIAETAPASLRGRLVALYQLAIVLGILLAYFSNYLFDGFGEHNWRYMFISQIVPSFLFLALLLVVPETPRWLVKNGLKEDALLILTKISGSTAANTEIEEIENTFKHEKGSSLKVLFSRAYRPVLFIGIFIAVFQQITGINSILYYAPVIFKETGLSTASSMLQTIGIGVVNVISTFIAIGLVDKVGRKIFLLSGCVLMGLSLTAISFCFHFRYFDNYVVLGFMLMYVGAFGCTLGAVTWVYLSEIFPNRVRGIAMSVATLALWLADFIVTYTFPVMTRELGTSNTLFCYAAFCLIAFIYMFFRLPETKGKSLEEIESIFIK
ncbi:MFS transporter, SP family, arabinose:H+ symporter [Pedobacter steynii]|uniref:MFS transporter, SP family, arabinose:H+ symporter n=1 Tax=Pedobacter steynii TaxID=430522 RepID=A0A1G9Z094_9SPHI|nr:sugar porter family MFS transporter [Pedobacter steynii]NQX39901.1 sugar porter family MFS transporter [Pedobacter steynii]SDN14744.1 MFS transporter, SP family, arabinose:H+ symporter [Pedobacter steynii]